MSAAILEELLDTANAIVGPNGYFQVSPIQDGGFIIRPKIGRFQRLIEVSTDGNDRLRVWSRISNYFGGNVIICGWSNPEVELVKFLLQREIASAEAIVRLCLVPE